MVPKLKFCSVQTLLVASFLFAVPVLANDGNEDNTAGSKLKSPAKTSPAKTSPAKTSFTAASVSAVPRENILAISDKIDSMVQTQLTAKGEKRNRPSTDEVFLRRAYLDIIGRIPNVTETKAFLNSKNKNKRVELIDQLLDSYGYISRQYNFWADLLRVQTKLPGQLNQFSYIEFLKDTLEENKPYDEFVRELITASGANMDPNDGAVGYYLRDRNMPEDNMSNTIRIFLGTRLECAQCHDHPFDKWTQRQYFEMVAFTGGLRYRNPKANSAVDSVRKAYRKGELDGKTRGIANNLLQAMSHGISGNGTGLARLPEGFLGDDGYEGEIIVGKTMFEGKKLVDAVIPKTRKNKNNKRKNNQQGNIFGAKAMNSREVYADWLTDPTNPRFAKVISNRLWKQAFGVGLIEPIDIIEEDTVASNPELMDYLTETMIDLKFDTKQYLRAIYNSKTYQADAFNKDIVDPQKFNFNGPVVRRMSAEQIWDSLLTLTVPDVDRRSSEYNGGRLMAIAKDPFVAYQKLNSMSFDELMDVIKEIAAGGKGNRKKAYRDNPEFKKYAAKKAELNKKMRKARQAKRTSQMKKIAAQLADVEADFRMNGPGRRNYRRASEMESPAPAGHFLRDFGQSDRETIENSNTDPAIPQVLSMMNGYVEDKIARDQRSVLYKTISKASNARQATELAFLSMLNRKPTPKEAREWNSEFASASKKKDQSKIDEVRHDLIWTLANSNEFIFIK